MPRKRWELPERNELVVGTIEKIYDHGAFVTLDEYGGLEAYVPLNEVSHSWFKGIREVLKVGQKRVFKVIRVNRAKKQVDVSLKRVGESERRRKMFEWKRAQRAEKLLELAAKKLGRTLDDAYEEAGWKIEDHYGEIFAGLEEAAMRGRQALLEAGVPEEWAEVLEELARSSIKISKVRISGVFTIRCMQSDGVERLRRILTSWKEATKGLNENVRVRMFIVGPPKYRVDVEALDYKTAEQVMKTIVDRVTGEASSLGCTCTFERVERG